jgi:hypothetical protein
MSNITDFLEVLENEGNSTILVEVSSKKNPIKVKPLSFKQQKTLITSGMNGVVGIMSFMRNLNEIIMNNSELNDLKIYDRIPIILHLRKQISNKKLQKDDVEVSVDQFIDNLKKFDLDESKTIDGKNFTVNLKIPTLKEENSYLAVCIEELKKIDEQNVGKNVSLILSYEIPKFIESIHFGDKTLSMSELTFSEKTKLMDNVPADITNQITDFILKIREFDESLLSHEGTYFDIDYSFFE